MAKYTSIGRINLEFPGNVEDIPKNLSNIERDERIIGFILKNDGIFITADKQSKANAVAHDLFTIFA